jgi:hypothetical protein
MSIKISGILSPHELVDHHAQLGWQCPECFGIQVKTYKDRFALESDRFECQECGATWHRS